MRRHKRLFAAFTALLCFQTCFMRFCFMTVERAGLIGYENLVFILYCAAIVCGLALAPLFLDRTRLAEPPAQVAAAARACLAASAAFAIAGYFVGGYAALTLQFFTMLFYAGALAAVLRVASACLAPRLAGRLNGFSGAVMHLVIMVIFYQPFFPVSAGVTLCLLCVMLAAAGLFFTAARTGSQSPDDNIMPFTNYTPFIPRVIRLGMAALVLFVIFGGLQDNIFYFDAVFANIPNFHFYIFTYNILINVAAGFIFERADPALAAVGALALICASQSMAMFSTYEFLAYPYTVLSNAGFLTMEVYLFAMPVAYVALTGKKPGVLPGLGFMMLYASFAVTAMLFEFLPPAFYGPAQGVMLLVAVAAILVTVYLMNENKLHRLALLQAELKELKDRPLPPYDGAKLLEPLTEREQEVLRFILAGKTNKEIAAAMNVSVSAIKFHVSNIYGKYTVNSRLELVSALANK